MIPEDEACEEKTALAEKATGTKTAGRKIGLVFLWASRAAFVLMTLALCALLVYIGVLSFLPIGYYVAAITGAVILCTAMFLALFLRKKAGVISVICLIMSLILLLISILGISALDVIYNSIYKTNQGANTVTIHVSVYVRADSPYEYISDLESCTFGIRMDEMNDTIEQTLDKIKGLLENQLEVRPYDDFAQLIQGLKNGEIDALIMDQALVATVTDAIDDTFASWTRVIPVELKVEQDVQINEVSVSKTPFIVYISGLDTKGTTSILDNGRSDVNQIAVINPVSKKILLINTPRDTYVALGGDPAKMDKLTHAGVYGINCSIDTLEALYDIEINYYVKVNFASLINVVDALGGVTVQSDYDFTVGKYTFNKGTNYLTGEEALVFVRRRYNLPGGDMQRGVHQQRVIQAVIKKITSPSIITNFTSVLNVITDNTKTNLPSESINELIQMQLSDMEMWDVQTYAMFGNGLMGTLYAFGTQVPYSVLSAPEEQVSEIKTLIRQMMQVK